MAKKQPMRKKIQAKDLDAQKNPKAGMTKLELIGGGSSKSSKSKK